MHPKNNRKTKRSLSSLVTPAAAMELEKYDDLLVAGGLEGPDCDTNTAAGPNTVSQHADGIISRSWMDLQCVTLLGEGVSSSVFLAVDSSTQSEFALKCLNPQRFDTPADFLEAAGDLANECMLLQRLNHPNIISMKGICASRFSESYNTESSSSGGNGDHHYGGFFFLMDVLSETLKDRLDRWRLEDGNRRFRRNRWFFRLSKKSNVVDKVAMYDRLENVAVGLVQGLHYLHEEQSIVMRDLKPANIGFLVSYENGMIQHTVKLLDFGLSRRFMDKKKKLPKDDAGAGPQSVAGTPRYMAPEVMLEQGTSFASDVYSLGIILYEICSLEIAFEPQKTLDDVEQHVAYKGARPDLSVIPCYGVRALLEVCWAHDPKDRPTIAHVQEMLSSLLEPKKVPEPPALACLLVREASSSTVTRRTFGVDESQNGSDEEDTLQSTYQSEKEDGMQIV